MPLFSATIVNNSLSYYQFYSEMKWGRIEGQDILINSGLLGIDGTVALLKTLVEEKMGK